MVFLKEKIRALVSKAAKEPVKIEYPAESTHGDYATNAAFELGKKMKRNPAQVADELAQKIIRPPWISKIERAGAGFLNFFLAEDFLTKFLDDVMEEGARFGASEIQKGKTVVTDTSHPNVAKPMGAHHLLSTIIGNALNRIFAAVGYRVIRDNYLGDWGTQFGKLIYAYKTWGNETAVKKNPIPELLKLYVKFHDEAERDASLEEKGRNEFKKMEKGDRENRALWKWIADLSLSEFKKIWDRLDVRFDYIHGESFYEDKMDKIIEMGKKNGVFVTGEGGALIARLDHLNMPPCLIRKSDGATLYATRDLARTKYWEDTWRPDLMVIVADSAQTLHFRQFFEVAKTLGITDAVNIHVVFGRMRFPEKRMSTRKGNIVLLEELLDEAEEGAYKIVCAKNPELPEAKKREVARCVGIGAVKYAVLSQNRLTDVTFTWEKMLSLEGNSGPYLQYGYARANSILRRKMEQEIGSPKAMKQATVGKQLAQPGKEGKYILREKEEVAVARLFPKFPEIVAQAAEEFKPNLIANYLYELTSRFNTFYGAIPVLRAEPEKRAVRLKLVEAVALTLKNGLALLGIEAPEEM